MDVHTLVKVVILVGFLAPTTTGFLFDDHRCVMSASCYCSGHEIACLDKALRNVPHFDVSMYKGQSPGYFRITLERNNITSISSNAFGNISFINASRIHLDFSSNSIARIDPLAFLGIENRTKVLDLRFNNLSTLPSAIARLNGLEELLLIGNPLSNLDIAVLSHVGHSLVELNFDMSLFTYWPRAMSTLQHVRLLHIDSVPFADLPETAFKGIESSLQHLTISNSNFTRVPTSICNLHNINIIDLENAKFQSNSVFTPCSHTLPATEMSLLNLSIHEFPDVLHTFPSLERFNLAINEISFIPSDVIPMSSRLLDLMLDFNQLTHIPFALNKLTNLITLYISHNKIATIEDHDLIGLSNLGELNLNSNPIEYIALNAFDDNTRLYSVSLDNTKLHRIPEVVKVQHVDFTFYNLTVECSCRMSYLKGWDPGDTTRLDDNCANRQNETVKHYILNELRQCP